MIKKLLFRVTLLNGIVFNAIANPLTNPCSSDAALLNIIDRPTAADSACVVPNKHIVIETGYQNVQLRNSNGYLQNVPEAEFRLGLPANNELVVLIPNYIHQSFAPQSGFTATALGIKHEISYTQNWIATMEVIFTLPSGSAAFGSNGMGTAFNGIFSYNIHPKFNLSFMIGGSTETLSRDSGGNRFESINPDLVLTFAPTTKINFYGEVYGQSKTSPDEGSGFNVDGGVIYLLWPSFTIDLEYGQRLTGNLGGFDHYIGCGMTLMI